MVYLFSGAMLTEYKNSISWKRTWKNHRLHVHNADDCLPSNLLRSALCTSGWSSERRLRSAFAQTINAFIGLRMWVAGGCALDFRCLDAVTRKTTSSLLVVVEEALIGTIVDSSSSAVAATVMHVQLSVELLAGWTSCVTNWWNSSSVDHGSGLAKACADMAAIGDNISVADPACIVKSARQWSWIVDEMSQW